MDAGTIIGALAILAVVTAFGVILEAQRRNRKITEAAERKRRRDLRKAEERRARLQQRPDARGDQP